MEAAREREWHHLINRIKAIKESGIRSEIWKEQVVGYNYLSRLLELKADESEFRITSFGLIEWRDFICYAGICVFPRLSLSAENSIQAFDAWVWFLNKLSINGEEFTQTVERSSIYVFLRGFVKTPIPFKVIGLAVDLYRLHNNGIDTVPKIRKLNKDIQGYVDKAKKLEVISRFYTIGELLKFLEDISSETKLGVIAWFVGYRNITLRESPDLEVDGIPIEVKHPRKGTESAIRNNMEKGLNKANLVAIDFLSFQKKWLRGYKITDLGEISLEEAFKTAMSLVKNKERCILFFGSRLYPNMTVGYVGHVVKIRK